MLGGAYLLFCFSFGAFEKNGSDDIGGHLVIGTSFGAHTRVGRQLHHTIKKKSLLGVIALWFDMFSQIKDLCSNSGS